MNLNNIINRIKQINSNIIMFIGSFDDNNNKTGYWEYYFSNGNLEWKGNYVNGKRHGYWEDYFDNGKLYSKGNYLNGKADGYWEYYYFNGNLRRKVNYINGIYEQINVYKLT